MELGVSALSASGSALVMLGYQSWKCYKKTKKRIDECKKICLLLPKKSGKSRLVSLLNGTNENILIYDMDETIKNLAPSDDYLRYQNALKSNDNGLIDILYNKMCRYVVDYVKKNNKNSKKKILFICGRLESMSVLKNVIVGMPSNQLFETILSGLTEPDKEQAKKERVKYLQSFDSREVFVYNTFEELNSKVSSAFNLKYSL